MLFTETGFSFRYRKPVSVLDTGNRFRRIILETGFVIIPGNRFPLLFLETGFSAIYAWIMGTENRCGNTVRNVTACVMLPRACNPVHDLHRFYQFYTKVDQKARKTGSLPHRSRNGNKLLKARSDLFSVTSYFMFRHPETVLPGTERLF